MKKDAENNEKDVLQGKNALSEVVQVNFTEKADDKKGGDTIKSAPVKAFDKSASKQELLKEIERLSGVIDNKDAEIKRLNDRFDEIFDIEGKREESIAIHKKAVDALADAVRESEKIIENAKKVAEKIIKSAGDPVKQETDSFNNVSAFKPAPQVFAEQQGSVAEETMQELMQIRNSSFNADSRKNDDYNVGYNGDSDINDDFNSDENEENNDDYDLNELNPVVKKTGEKVKLPGADYLVVSEDILTVNSMSMDGLAGINMDEIDEFLASIKNDSKRKLEETGASTEAIQTEEEPSEQNGSKDADNLESDDKKKKVGWFKGFSKKK